MSAVLEQTPAELDYLIGARVRDIKIHTDTHVHDGVDYGIGDTIQITFVLPKAIRVEKDMCDLLTMEVLQDPEGNGPGFLALVDAGTL